MEDTPQQSPAQPELTRAERRKLRREETRQGKDQYKSEQAKKGLARKILMITAAIAIAAVIGFLAYSKMASAKSLDSFADCLTKKGAVIYGNEWCKYTQRQKNMFGNSFTNLKYVICDQQKSLCDEKQITTTPTWEIDGKMHQEVQSIETLSRLTGCQV